MGFIEALGSTMASVPGAALGLGIQSINDRRQIRQQERLQNLQIQGQKQMMDYGYNKQLQMWEATSYPAQMEMMKKAGLNPGLMYGMGGGGGQTTGNANSNVSGGNAPSGGNEIQGGMGLMLQAEMQKAQIAMMQSQADKNQAEADKTRGIDTEEAKTRKELNILEGVIKQYTGMEARDVYQRVTAPNRSIQSKTYMDEMEARQGLAGTIYELWRDGKLEEKAYSEIESIALSNAKSKEERRKIAAEIDILEENLKGVKLENIMKDLEMKLQTETGIDRNSPAWMKVLGRLFVTLLNK